MIEQILAEELIKAVVSMGFDTLAPREHETVDLTPLKVALDELNGHSRDILTALAHPTRTAGAEMYDRAVTAFGNGWHEDALSDALQSIEIYPYDSRPRLLGGLAALALGRVQQGLNLLVSAVKYAANGQPEVGAVAAIVVSRLSESVGGHRLAEKILTEADGLTGGRCPGVVGALSRAGFADADKAGERLRQLWWDDQGAVVSGGYSRDLFRRTATAVANTVPEYHAAGNEFMEYLHRVSSVCDRNVVAFGRLETLIVSIRTRMSADVPTGPVKRALELANPRLRLGLLDMNVKDVLIKCIAVGGSPGWPGGDVWTRPEIPTPKRAAELIQFVRWSCGVVLQALAALPALVGDASLRPADRERVRSALSTLPAWVDAFMATRSTCKDNVIIEADGAWSLFEGMRREPRSVEVIHLPGVAASLFLVVGGAEASTSDTKRDASVQDVAGPTMRRIADQGLVTVRCPGCSSSQTVPEGTTRSTCDSCGKQYIFRGCMETDTMWPILEEWSSWTHPNCSVRHLTSRVPIACPQCRHILEVEPDAQSLDCPSCGSGIVFNKCAKCSGTFPVVSRNSKWTCPTCRQSRQVSRPT